MDIGEEAISVAVPSEIFHSREEFFAALQEAGREQHPLLLQNFGVKFTSGVPVVMLTAGGYLFRLCWGSGAHRGRNCRMLLGFEGSEDTEDLTLHTSRRWDDVMLKGAIERLSLKPGKLTAFAEHLILETLGDLEKGDQAAGDGGPALEFEDFHHLFRKHLRQQEGLRKARNLLMLGFMGHEECAAVAEREAIDLTRRRKLRKLIRQRKQFKDRNRQQNQRMLETGARLKLEGVVHVQSRGWARQTQEVSRELTEPCRSEDSKGSLVGDAPGEEALCGRKTKRAKKHSICSDQELEGRKVELLARRQRTRAIRKAQGKSIRARALRSLLEAAAFEAGRQESERWGATKGAVELAKLGLEGYNRPGQTSKQPLPEDIHAACLGYFHRRRRDDSRTDSSVRSPVFFGCLHGALLDLRDGGSVRGNLSALRDLLKMKAFHRRRRGEASRACLAFPLVPVTRGKVRQRMRTAGEAYDRGELVHPSCFGTLWIPDDQDARNLSPVFFGYELAANTSGSTAWSAAGDKELGPCVDDFVPIRRAKPCALCLTGRPGCPACWDFPKGWLPHDFAYLGPFKDDGDDDASANKREGNTPEDSRPSPRASGDLGGHPNECVATGASPEKEKDMVEDSTERMTVEEAKEERRKPDFHTSLTTPAAIALYRSIVACIIRVFVKARCVHVPTHYGGAVVTRQPKHPGDGYEPRGAHGRHTSFKVQLENPEVHDHHIVYSVLQSG